jgi:hypothetical protein
MNVNTAQITQKIEFLHTRYLDELNLFIEFLMVKQQKDKQEKIKPKSKKINILADMQTLAMPVSDFIIQRDTIYEDRL